MLAASLAGGGGTGDATTSGDAIAGEIDAGAAHVTGAGGAAGGGCIGTGSFAYAGGASVTVFTG